jgi:hypothetical protein
MTMTRKKAEQAALKLAIAHFANRHDVTQAIFDGFMHRETLRLMGEPVTPYRVPRAPRGRPAAPRIVPTAQPPARAMSDLERLLAESIEEKAG